MKTQILILLILIPPTSFAQIGYIKDIEGNKYRFSEFGKHELMLDNLCATKYQNGDPIPLVPGDSDWRGLSTDAYCNYKNNEENGKTFGRLYNYLAVADKRNLCPSGWHVPSVNDWIKLEEYAKTENGNSINLYVFSTKEDNSNTYGGSRGIKGWFFNLEKDGEWWSATSQNKNKAWCSYLLKRSGNNSLMRLAEPKYVGLSVRCMRDTSIWTKVTMDTTIKTLKEYLAIYPQGKHVEEAYLILQDRFGIPSPCVLPNFNPSLTGYKNTVFVETDTVGKNGKKMVVFWSNSKTPYTLVASNGGIIYGNKSDLERGPDGDVSVTFSMIKFGDTWTTKSNAAFTHGPKGELLTYGLVHLAIEGETEFVNNLDYEGSTLTFLGTVNLMKSTFISDEQEPLVFTLEKGRGFVYVKGKGKVLTEKGHEFRFK